MHIHQKEFTVMWFLTLLTFLCVSYHSEGYIDSSDKLQHLHILFRHGDRTPFVDFISNSSSAWARGFGQLTDKGVLQEFQLGQWIRSEYGYFIPQSYNASDFLMRSTDIDRTLQSAQAVSAGIYQNGSTPLSNFSINWRPVPVHTVDQVEDILLSAAPCPCLQALRKAQFKTDAAVAFAHNHSKLFDMLSNRFGRKIIPQNIWMISDTLICMRAHDKPWPSWMTEELFNELIEVATYYWKVQFTNDRDIVRLEIGVFLDTVLTHFLAVIQTFQSPHKPQHVLAVQHSMIYSAHDTDVSYVLAALGTFESLVKYSGAVVFELWGPSSKPVVHLADYSLRLHYKRGYPDHVSEYVQINACSEDAPPEKGCPLDKVFDYLKPLRLTEDEFVQVCAVRKVYPFTTDGVQCSYIPPHGGGGGLMVTYIAVITILTVCLVAVIALVFFWRIRRRFPASQIPFFHLDPEL